MKGVSIDGGEEKVQGQSPGVTEQCVRGTEMTHELGRKVCNVLESKLKQAFSGIRGKLLLSPERLRLKIGCWI